MGERQAGRDVDDGVTSPISANGFHEDAPASQFGTVDNEAAGTEASDAATSKNADAPERDRSWLRLTAAILFVLLVAGSFTYLMRDQLTTPAGEDTAFRPAVTDRFDRPSDASQLGGVGAEVWETLSGTWGVDAGRAIIAEADEDGTNVAILLTAETGTIEALVGGAGRCGLVARQGASGGEIALVQVGGFGVWNLVRVVDGDNELLASLPFIPDRDSVVRLTVGARLVLARIGNTEVSVVLDDGEPASGGFGLVAFGEDAGGCSWDDVSIFQGR